MNLTKKDLEIVYEALATYSGDAHQDDVNKTIKKIAKECRLTYGLIF